MSLDRLNGDISPERKSLHESSWSALYIWLRWSLDLLQAGKCSAGSFNSAAGKDDAVLAIRYLIWRGISFQDLRHMFIIVN